MSEIDDNPPREVPRCATCYSAIARTSPNPQCKRCRDDKVPRFISKRSRFLVDYQRRKGLPLEIPEMT